MFKQPMNATSSNSRPQSFLLAVLFLALCIVGFLTVRDQTAKRDARLAKELSQLRQQLDRRDQIIEDLRASVRQLQAVTALPPATPSRTATPAPRELLGELDWVERLHELEVRQSNTLVMVERMAERAPDTEALEALAAQMETLLARDEGSGTEDAQALEAARQRTAEMLVGLAVPVEVAEMEAGKALENPALQTYWPYFEAKQVQDSLETLALRLRSRSLSDRPKAAPRRSRARQP